MHAPIMPRPTGSSVSQPDPTQPIARDLGRQVQERARLIGRRLGPRGDAESLGVRGQQRRQLFGSQLQLGPERSGQLLVHPRRERFARQHAHRDDRARLAADLLEEHGRARGQPAAGRAHAGIVPAADAGMSSAFASRRRLLPRKRPSESRLAKGERWGPLGTLIKGNPFLVSKIGKIFND